MTGKITELVQQSTERTREATLSVLGISDPGLRAHLTDCLSDDLEQPESLLAPVMFEHTFGWQTGDETLGQLSGDLLSERTVNALADTLNPDYRFDRELKPYRHQLSAWRALGEQTPKSAVITTGTGSGKTECFMVPILDDLLREQESLGGPLVGVRAMFLYPLNALINSQRERLDAWTAETQADIRYCLYNGNTEKTASAVRKKQAAKPNEILSRELMRQEPAPILMTNATMLEYMLVRQDDAPIFELSRAAESLRWIVLDEAHTYIGSQAAEIAMLLRRVVAAFGKRAEEIRFVATSATIAGEGASKALRSYLAALAGVPDDRVVVISGHRTIPPLKSAVSHDPMSFEDLSQIDAGEVVSPRRYDALGRHPMAIALRNKVVGSSKPTNLTELKDCVRQELANIPPSDQQTRVLAWIELMTSTRPLDGDEPFLKVRAHLFQRLLHGLWSCVDPHCSAKSEHLSKSAFGNLYTKQRSTCECGAPVFEYVRCDDCGAAHLMAEDAHGVLRQTDSFVDDEFSLQTEAEDDSDVRIDQIAGSREMVIAAKGGEGYDAVPLGLDSARLGDFRSKNQITIHIQQQIKAHCVECGFQRADKRDFTRRAYLGAPFYVTNAVPTVLEFCPPHQGPKDPMALPEKGRRLITFTDSRQGTARMALRMQQEAERARLRGMVFTVLNNQVWAGGAPNTRHQYEGMLAAAELSGNQAAADFIREQIKTATESTSDPSLSWSEMIEALEAIHDLKHSMLRYNKYANPHLFSEGSGEKTLASVLLLREFARRPKYQNSAETLGLVSVGYHGLENVVAAPEVG